MAASKIMNLLKNPFTVAISTFGLALGGYSIIDMTQSGAKYELEEDLTGKTFIVTGATSGIGKALALKLADNNARVIMACRNREKCLEIRRDIVLNSRNKQVFCRMCDLSDFESIKTFVSKICEGEYKIDRIDALINNAAIMLPKRKINPNGIENTLATNHMGTFLLTGLLLEKLLKQENPSRIVFVNTNIAASDKIVFDLNKLNNVNELEKFDGFETYKLTKTAELLFAKELANRLKDTNITVITSDPGRTNSSLTSQMPFQTFFLSRWILKFIGFFMGERKLTKAVKPVLYAAADPDAANKNGIFIDRERKNQNWGKNAEDADLRNRLWIMSELWTNFIKHYNDIFMKQDESVNKKTKKNWFFF